LDKVSNPGKCESYVSAGGEVIRVDLGSEDYVIIDDKGTRGVDIDFRRKKVTVYDDKGGWILRQIGKQSGRGFTYEKYSEYEIKTEKERPKGE